MEEPRRSASNDIRPMSPSRGNTLNNQASRVRKSLFGRKFSKLPLSWLLVIILLIAAIGTAGYYVNRYQDSQKQVERLSNPTEAAKNEQQKLIAEVGKLVQLPQGETPTVATVTDTTKLKDQAFFVNAQNGDKVLIYTQAKQAIMYRPSTNKIINIAPVNIGDNGNQPAR